ncbi:hypothetical protein ACQ4M4_14540 [Leptolyngbya sp. AN02str]|uniref:hypothetical protein n=1 Tax=Leptolyngbya sp. AN02str TaxID=3423363 RepID=UPI003D314AB2
MDHPAKTNFKARNLILDYALGATIIALLPIPNIRVWQAIALVLLNVLLVSNLARLWQSRKRGGLLARIGVLFGIVGAMLMGLLVWVVVVMGVVVPLIGLLAPGIATFSYFWGMGQAVNHFYVSQSLIISHRSPSSDEHDEI